MKKILQCSKLYLIAGLVAGVFYREFTKFTNFAGKTQLSVTHTHLLMMGMFFMLFVLVLEKLFQITQHKNFNRFFASYNIGLILTIIMMLTRGTLQVNGTVLSNGINGMISGISGLGHIILTVGLVYLFKILKQQIELQ